MYFIASFKENKTVLSDANKIWAPLRLWLPVHNQSNLPFYLFNTDVMNALRNCQLPEATEKHTEYEVSL